MFSVCALFYGDYPDLAKRLLDSLRVNEYVQDFRFGLNQVGHKTLDYIHSWSLQQYHQQKVYVYTEANGANIGKYPLMRQMFRDRTVARRIMWFDDDSYVDSSAGKEWWSRAYELSRNKIQVGAVHLIMQRNKQYEVIQQQSWFTGKVINAKHRFEFATGGWWIADSSFLLQWDYPFPALYHNGGDSILGELLRQQGHSVTRFPGGVQCHCESCLRHGTGQGKPVVHINVGGRKGRRGIGVQNERYVWNDGNPVPSLTHQNFDMRVLRYEV